MAALVGTVGCGDDDGTPVDSGTAPRDSGPGMTDAGPGMMMDGMVAMVDAGPGMTDGGGTPGMGCINATDPAALMANYADGGAVDPDGGMGSSFRTLAGVCGLSCITAADIPACVTTCLRARTGNAVSEACATCYGISVECTAAMCSAECTTAAGPTAPACIACQCGAAACIPDLATCTGIPTTACDTPDAG